MADNAKELILAQNQFAYVQEEAKGGVSVWVGPSKQGLTPTDRPVVYNKTTTKFDPVELAQAITQFIFAPEGSYIVLENPPEGDKHPDKGSNQATSLKTGRKVNIPGPSTFPLWPGEVAEVIAGHHLRSNQYLFVRVYNDEEANKTLSEKEPKYTIGQQLVIKGTEVAFYIPPTGFEVLKDSGTGSFVREALTLERLEYCILLNEDGNKRYERGPKVVFPDATEKFMQKTDESGGGAKVKFKAIELNDQMGLYIKVIADYKEEIGTWSTIDVVPEEYDETNGHELITNPGDSVTVFLPHKIGEELFITGKQQRIYYPQAEHASIQYKDAEGKFNRDRYYGIAIPRGEARYVLNKNEGDVKTVKGPQIFLPDPRNEIIVRRVLDKKTVELWYPSNQEAINYNENLRSLLAGNKSYVDESAVKAATLEATRNINRGTQFTKGLVGASLEGEKLTRGSNYTPPPAMLTLDTKYDGVPLISVWTGFAVQIVDKSGKRRVEIGPTSILLAYDETLEVMSLSTGKPKTTDNTMRTAYLQTLANRVSDIVNLETQDMVNVAVKLSYRVNFEGDKNKWFNVDNYVKFLCDHLRSVLRARAKEFTIEKFIQDGTAIVRDTILGKSTDGKRNGKSFEENGMRVYDVEVLNINIGDALIAKLLQDAQTETVKHTITLQTEGKKLELVKQQKKNEMETANAEAEVAAHRHELKSEQAQRDAEFDLNQVESSNNLTLAQGEIEKAKLLIAEVVAKSLYERKSRDDDQKMKVLTTQVELNVKQLDALNDKLVPALHAFSQSEWAERFSEAVAPLAIIQQCSPANILSIVLKNTPLEGILEKATKALTEKTNS
jgi:major vault protein